MKEETMKFSKLVRKALELNGYEYLDSKYCYAKRNKNIAIHQSCDKKFYINITSNPYKRGSEFVDSGIFIGYFDDLQELFDLLTILEKYEIKN